jgi:hypothetical protein
LSEHPKLQRWKPGFVTKLKAEGPTGVNRIIDALNNEQGSAPTPRMRNRYPQQGNDGIPQPGQGGMLQQGQAAILVITSSISATEYLAVAHIDPAGVTISGVTLKLYSSTTTLATGYATIGFLAGTTWWAQPADITLPALITALSNTVYPFGLSVHSSITTRLVIGATRADADYQFNDHLIVGLDKLAKTAAENINSFSSGENWVGYAITKSGSTITATAHKATGGAPPAQADGTVYFTLGYVTADGSGNLSNVYQTHRGGDVHMPARVS